MKKISTQFLIKLFLAALAIFIAWNFPLISGAFGKIVSVFQPVLIGIVTALILNVPMEFFENVALKKIKRPKIKRGLALFISVILFVGVLALLFGLAIPSAVDGLKNFIGIVSEQSTWDKIASRNRFLNFLVEQGKILYENFSEKLQDYVPKMLVIAQKVLKTTINILLGLAIAVMLLANKVGLKKQTQKIINRVFRKKNVLRITEVTDMAINKFSRYLGGQVIEAVILGTVCYLLMLLLGFPYAPLISLIIGFVNLIPIVGAYIGGALSALLIFAVNPTKALLFIVFIVILQQTEAFTTYPVVVGKYVGLNSFWIMVSIVIWGGIFGFWGVFLGVPFTAFLHDYIKSLLEQKEPVGNLPALPPEPR